MPTIKDDDDAWTRVQRQVAEELDRAAARAQRRSATRRVADPSDWGFVVHIVYQNRPERPDRLAARLAEEIAAARASC